MAATTHEMTNSEGNSYTLRERLEDLPQELYDMIYDFTFTAEAQIRLYWTPPKYGRQLTRAQLQEVTKAYSTKIVTINETPRLLHVDRASRKKYAESFYGNPNSVFIASRHWLPGDKTHLKLVNDLRIAVHIVTHHDVHRQRCMARFLGKSPENIPFIDCNGIEALLKERADIADAPCA